MDGLTCVNLSLLQLTLRVARPHKTRWQTMNLFERYLTLWVGLAIIVGIALGQLFPQTFAFIAALEVAKVNLPVAVLV
jgi:ACR3 family arsenite efflux pump ArsB